MKKISIIIPCYNEGKNILNSINSVKNYLESELSLVNYEIIVVNDGSTDSETKEIFKISKINKVKFISYMNNKGKGYAIKEGIRKATNDIIIFMDADLSIDLSAIKSVVENIEKFDIVIASRHHKKSKIIKSQPLYRKIMGYLCSLITRLITGLKFKDTQCGFKGFKKDIAKKLIKKQKVNRWAFDVEYLYVACLKNYSVKEIPIVLRNDSNSTVDPIKSSLIFLKDLIRIRKNKKYYMK